MALSFISKNSSFLHSRIVYIWLLFTIISCECSPEQEQEKVLSLQQNTIYPDQEVGEEQEEILDPNQIIIPLNFSSDKEKLEEDNKVFNITFYNPTDRLANLADYKLEITIKETNKKFVRLQYVSSAGEVKMNTAIDYPLTFFTSKQTLSKEDDELKLSFNILTQGTSKGTITAKLYHKNDKNRKKKTIIRKFNYS